MNINNIVLLYENIFFKEYSDSEVDNTINNENENENENNSVLTSNKQNKKVKKVNINTDFLNNMNQEYFLSNKFNILELKEICKHYKLKISGNKKELIERIETFFKMNKSAIIIQKSYMKYIYKKYKKLHGPARMERSLCVNNCDFFTMDPLKDIPYLQFFSYKDNDGKIYGFDLLSIYTLAFKDNENNKIKNPYNRNEIPRSVIKKIKKIVKLSKLLKHDIVIKIEEDKQNISPEKEIELLCNSLFQYIDRLGNYTDSSWFWSLNSRQLLKFIYELNDIWYYRSQLSYDSRNEICPPMGNPFYNVPLNINSLNLSLYELRKISLKVIERMIKRGITESHRSLGANYVLCALTLVSEDAAIAIPWLYQSVSSY